MQNLFNKLRSYSWWSCVVAFIDTNDIHERSIHKSLQSGRIGTWETDLVSSKQVWSSTIVDILGFDAIDNPTWDDFINHVHPDDQNLVSISVQNHLDKNTPYEVEYRIIDSKMNIRWMYSTGNAEFNLEGKPLKMWGIIQEISERKKTEETLSGVTELLENVINTSQDHIFVKDKQLRIILCNDFFARARGKKPVELYGVTDIENSWTPKNIKGDSKNNTYEFDEHDVLKGETIRKSNDSINIEGKTRYFDTMKLPLRDSEDNIIGVLGVSRDITESKQGEEALQKLSRAVESSSSIVMMTDMDGNLEYVNSKFTDITGYTKEEVIGENPRILKSEETSEEAYVDLWETILAGNEWKGEFHNRKKDGSYYWGRSSISGVKDEKGDITHFIGIQEDVTREYELNEQLSYQASHDGLTGLINRFEFERRAERLITAIKQDKDEHAMCYLDLDQFKVVNDTCGHAAAMQCI